MIDGIELVSGIITRYANIEERYLRPISRIILVNGAEMKMQLTEALIKLYIAVLRYISKARRSIDRESAGISFFSSCFRLSC
jgi:hypothetical protein